MDAIYTFHLPCREFTLDPISFSAITGIACVGDAVPFDRSLEMTSPSHVTYIDRLFGMVPLMKGTYTIKVDLIQSYYSMIPPGTITTPKQVNQMV